jgi:hypothetical protein
LIGQYKGVLEWDAVEKFVADCVAAGALPHRTSVYAEIVSIDVTNDVAAVKVVDDFQGSRFTDYLTLLKAEEGWKIVSKVFHNHA